MKEETGKRGLFSALSELVYPPERRCLACGSGLGAESLDGVLCRGCREGLERLQEDFREEEEEAGSLSEWPEGPAYVHCAYPYRGAAVQLVYRLKYDRVRRAAIPLCEAMTFLPAEEEELIIPIPTTGRRKRERGFNQAELLARGLARRFGMPVDARALIRVGDREPQARLRGEERLRNLAGTFLAGPSVAGKRILLIDDVYTTGATAREAVRALRAAGCERVGMLAACRAGLDDDPMQ